MNDFELKVLPSAWRDALDGKALPLLQDEIKWYHHYAKNPDTGDNFRRYYSQIEPLHAFLAENVYTELNSGDPVHLSKRNRIEKSSKLIKIDNFLNKYSKIAVLKGTVQLAHGDVLKKQIESLSDSEMSNVGVVLLDYRYQTLEKDFSGFPANLLPLGDVPSLKDRYIVLAKSIAKLYSLSDKKEIIWWGIPFGMVFTYNLARKFHSIDYRIDTSSNVTLSLITVKHHFAFSSSYLDRIYTSTPLVSGFSKFARPSILGMKPNLYSSSSLINQHTLKNPKDIALYDQLKYIKSQGLKIISSVSRLEKTSGSNYIQDIDNLLEQTADTVYLYFGKTTSKQYKYLVDKFSQKRCINAGWPSPTTAIKLTGLLDLFIDPYPFGAGMTYVSAALQGVPIISTKDYVHTSPSTISILYYHFLQNNFTISDDMLKKFLFGSSKTTVSRAIACLNNNEKTDHCLILKNEIKSLFVDSNYSLLRPVLI